MKKLFILTMIVGIGHISYGQTYNDFETDSTSTSQPFTPSKTQFMIRGYGHTGLNFMNSEGEKESSYVGSAFAPIFLFKHSDKLIFEAELEFGLEGNELEVGLEYANVMYVLNKNMTVRALERLWNDYILHGLTGCLQYL